MRKLISLLILIPLCFTLLINACAEEDSYPFMIRNGSRDTPMIAITVDDCFEMEPIAEILELCRQYSIKVTIFPLGGQIRKEDGALWREVVDTGCEIGSHSYYHNAVGQIEPWTLLANLGKTQQLLDEALGYHYEIRNFRPPYGNIADEKGDTRHAMTTIRSFGYKHIIHWEVSETDPDKAIWKVRNGSILLYHARAKDVNCLRALIPMLLEKGFQPVTVSELLGFGPNETGEELYIYNKADYPKKF